MIRSFFFEEKASNLQGVTDGYLSINDVESPVLLFLRERIARLTA